MMRPRPGESPQKSGRRFEGFFAKLFGTEPRRGSGNQWVAPLDVADGKILWSLKWTTHESMSISKALLHEADEAVHRDGNNAIPGIAMSIDSGAEVVVAMRWSDFARLLAQDHARYIVPSKGEQKRARSRVPAILRDADDAT